MLANVLTVNESKENYLKLGNGTLLLWGEKEFQSGSYGEVYVNFTIPFANEQYAFSYIASYDTSTGDYDIPIFRINLCTKTDLQIIASKPNAKGILKWIAIGRWK